MMKEKTKYETVDEYIELYPKNVKKILEKIWKTIKEIVPDAVETISYRIPTFKLKGNLVHFGAFKKHISFFPTSSPIREFKKELKKYEISKGTIKFF